MENLTLPVSGSVIALAVLYFLGRKIGDEIVGWIKQVNAHLIECSKKEVAEEALVRRVSALEIGMENVEKKVDTVTQAVNENHVELMQQLVEMTRGTK